VLQEVQDPLEVLDHRDNRARLVLLEVLESPDHRVHLVLQERLDQWEHREPPDH